MQITFSHELADAFIKSGAKHDGLASIAKAKHWYSTGVDSNSFQNEQLKLLLDLLETNEQFRTSAEQRKAHRNLKAIYKTRVGGDHARITILEPMAKALNQLIAKLPHHWLFHEEHGQLNVWFVDRVDYVPPDTRRDYYRPAYVKIEMKAKRRGSLKKKTVTFQREEMIGGRSAASMLEHLQLLQEDDELVARYVEEIGQYEKYVGLQGEQFFVTGTGETGYSDGGDDEEQHWWGSSNKRVNLQRVSEPTRAIMDDGIQFGNEGKDQTLYANTAYWDQVKKHLPRDEDYEDYNEDGAADNLPAELPVQPYLCVFSLFLHEFAVVHVSQLAPYEYDESLTEKLVLPKDHRRLIDVLVSTTDRGAEDIVRGKKGGVIILCSGEPGTGKTLTAEVYSEIAKRPLYMVQCSQLGIDAKELEKALGIALQRSIRWRAILLIDEADVYIHERGHDVNQNAIVGVFLRLLEYYAGILFLTTNRATVVDDAIRSRCLAHVRYTYPDKADLRRIWRILSRQYRVALDNQLIDELIHAFPQITGRNVKQLCRLAQTMRTEVDLDLFKWLAKYQDGVSST